MDEKTKRTRRKGRRLVVRWHTARFVATVREPGKPSAIQRDMTVGGAFARYECEHLHCGSIASIRSRGSVLCEVLGARRLDELDKQDVLRLREHAEGLPGRGGRAWSPGSVRHLLLLLRRVWKAEADAGRLTGRCPVVPGLLPGDVEATPEWRQSARFEREEIDALMLERPVPALARALVRLACMTWARAGELAALTFGDVNLSRKPLPMITISRAFQRTRNRIGTPKVQRYRYVPGTPPMIEWLESWRRWGWASIFGRAPTPSDFIVPTPDRYGAPRVMRPERAEDLIAAACDAVGIRRRSPHDIRRTCATLAEEEAKVDVRAIDAILHAPEPRTVSERYRIVTYPWLCTEIAKLRWPAMQLDLFGGRG